jgi:hypothetical protein
MSITPPGIFSDLLKYGIQPKLEGKDLVLEITTEQLKSIWLDKQDPRVSSSIVLELHEGRLVVKIRILP